MKSADRKALSMEALKIVAFSVSAACVYGIAHDMVTAHVCILWQRRPRIVQVPAAMPTNLFADLPESLPEELLETLLATGQVRIERIVSTGHASPNGCWYDQCEHEWVVVLQGNATLEIVDNGNTVTRNMSPGDHVLLRARQKHRVVSTAPDQPTVWLAVFFR